MSVEEDQKQINQQPELPKVETFAKPTINDSERLASCNLKTEQTYPNNPVEQFTFTKQFLYLRERGKSREDVLAMLGKYYHEEDFPFFNRLLDSVYVK
jgi:hypothetical protein